MCFPMNFAKFLRTAFLKNTSGGSFCITKVFEKRITIPHKKMPKKILEVEANLNNLFHELEQHKEE